MKQDRLACRRRISVVSNRDGNIAAIALAMTLAASGAGHAVTVVTDGVYDAAGGGSVDSSATSGANDVATFTLAVQAGHSNGLGGVIHFDLTSDASGNTLEATYASGTKTLNISTSANFNIQTFTSATVLSGRAMLLPQANGADDNTTLTFGSITGGLPLEAVKQVGFTLLSRNTTGYPQDVTITAFFSDGSNSVATSNLGGTSGTDDTFFGFTAPSGFAITSILFDPAGDSQDGRLVIDDFGFMTTIVPEPSTALLGCGALMLALARRRR